MPEYSKIEDKRELRRYLERIIVCEERKILAERSTWIGFLQEDIL
jgi:hypothetical protein